MRSRVGAIALLNYLEEVMSKEIRRVPPNWEHPKKSVWIAREQRSKDRYIPLYDNCVQEEFDQGLEEYKEWCESGMAKAMLEDPEFEYPNQPFRSFCYHMRSALDPGKYRPSWDEETATWYQVYESVSEGTLVTPPFKTQDGLINYLVANGDFWGDRWSVEAATNLVKKDGWQPSAVTVNGVAIDLSKEVVEC
jgi:hypothetical protein